MERVVSISSLIKKNIMQNLGLESVDIENKMEANFDRFDQSLKRHKESQRRISNSNPKLTSDYQSWPESTNIGGLQRSFLD